MKGKKPYRFATIKRLACLSALTACVVSTAILIIFYYSFRDALITDALRRVVEETVGYRVSLGTVRAVSLSTVSVERVDLAFGSTTISSGPTEVSFRLGLRPFLKIRRVVMKNPSISIDLSGEGGGGTDVIDRLMGMDIEAVGGNLTLIDKDKRYLFVGADVSYERGLFGGTLSFSGSAKTEGEGDGAILDGPFWGRMYIRGTYPDITVRGSVASGRSGWQVGGYLFSWEGLGARVSVDPGVVGASDVSVAGLSIRNDDLRLLLDEIDATGEIESKADGPLVLRGVRLSAPYLGEVDLDLTIRPDGRWEVNAASESLSVSGGNFRRLGGLLPDAIRGWGGTGRARGTVKVGTIESSDGGVAGDLTFDLMGLGFSSPDSLYLGEGISGVFSVRFRDDRRAGLLFDARLTAHDFGLLLSDFFLNFKDKRISARATGRIVEGGGVRGLDCEVRVPSVLVAHAAGDVGLGPAGTVVTLSGRFSADDVGHVFDLFFRDFFRNRAPSLYGADVRGSLNWRGTISGDLSAPRIRGKLDLGGTTIDLADIDTRIEGLSVSMPFSVDLSGTPSSGHPRRPASEDFGTISFSRAVVRGVEVEGTSLSAAFSDNAVTLGGDAVLSVAGGSVVIGDFSAADVFAGERTAGLSLDIAGVDVARLFPKEEALDLAGELSGSFPEIRIAGKKLFTSGGLTVKIFNGRVKLADIWGQDVFDAGRRIGCGVTFTDVDLGALTSTVDVGKVTGIAEGRISDLVFSYGGPERFVFDVSSVDRSRTKKRVSVEFVDKLTILGSGSTLLSGVLKGGINRFIHDYDYSKIGIHLELKDDYFTLRGKIHEGDKEYFIKRSGLTGINVINQNPENRIRFKDMMERLERINVKNTEDIRIEKR